MFYKKINYPDGDFYIELIDKKEEFTFRINSYDDLWELHHLIDVLNHNNIKPTITIPNLLSCQADRRFAKDQSFGLKLVLKHLIQMNANFRIFHPHNAEVVEMAFEICDKKVTIIDNSEFLDEVFSILVEDYDYDGNNLDANLIMLFPDGGAYKWGAKLADKKDFRGDVLAAAKNRKFIDGKSVLTQQLPNFDYKGKDILIIDDICIYGGTFKGLAKLLKEQGCNRLYLAVSHLTAQNHEKDSIFEYFDKVFTTNSKYDDYFVRIDGNSGKMPSNLEIIKLF